MGVVEGGGIDFLTEFGICGIRRASLTGVWVNGQKIASIGIAVKNWISFHGLSINLNKDDLNNFSFIRPCGMDIEMTSMESILNEKPDFGVIKEKIISGFEACLTGRQGGIYGQSALAGIR